MYGTQVDEIAAVLAELTPSSKAHGTLTLGHTPAGQPLGIPYSVVRGEHAHPCLWVNGAVHGNEAPGSITALRLLREVSEAPLHGSVLVTPVANPQALDNRSKHSPLDWLDIDQSFPGRPFLPTERTALRLFAAAAPVADCAVNLHTMSPAMTAVNYAVYKVPEGSAIAESQLLDLIGQFAPDLACRMDVAGDGELPGNIAGGLDYQLLALEKPAFMIEVGGGGVWDETQISWAVRGLRNLLARLGIERPETGLPDRPTRVTERTHITCSDGGFFRTIRQPGDRVPAGEPLGETWNVRGELVERVATERDVLVIGIRKDPVVHPGDRVAFVALDWDQ